MKEELLRLADRCEKAVFPCHDEASAMELVEIKSAICHLIFGRGYDAYSPDYTASLDAAMTLVPEGCVFTVMTDYGLPGRARVYGWPTDKANEMCAPILTRNCDAATPALALCAAALRASVKEQNNGG